MPRENKTKTATDKTPKNLHFAIFFSLFVRIFVVFSSITYFIRRKKMIEI